MIFKKEKKEEMVEKESCSAVETELDALETE